jgi:hypothetical protein
LPTGVFSYVDSLPLSFPYAFTEAQIAAADASLAGKSDSEVASGRIEALLRPYAPHRQHLHPLSDATAPLQAYLPPGRTESSFPSARLLALSAAALELLPLDVGDAHAWIAAQQGKQEAWSSGPKAHLPGKGEEEAEARKRYLLSDVLAGRAVGASFEQAEGDKGYAPFANAYAG